MNTAGCVAVEGTALYKLLAVKVVSITGKCEGCRKDECVVYTHIGQLPTSFRAEMEAKLSGN